MLLSVAIVLYQPNMEVLDRTLVHLVAALAPLTQCSAEDAGEAARYQLFLIDNGGTDAAALNALIARRLSCVPGLSISVQRGHGNVGYGRGHNLAIAQCTSRYHLVLNPDVEMAPDALRNALDFFAAHPEAGLIAPRVSDGHAHLQYLCRRFPAVFDLLLRGFAPASLKRLFAKRLAHYEMRTEIDAADDRTVVWDPPIISGCFMLFRTAVLQQLGGFDPRYFLYFEDYDLSLRTARVTRIAYVPQIAIVHHGGAAARKGRLHIQWFATSAFRFFNRFGWRWC